jgi:DNA polymerase III sliding clamp (beta) subunit (PCNA family)
MEITGTKLRRSNMKLTTTVSALLAAIEITKPTLDRKGVSADLYIKASETTNTIQFYSTNMTCETFTKVKGEKTVVEEPGEVLVNPAKLAGGLSGLDAQSQVALTTTPNGDALKVQSGPVKFSLRVSQDVKELATKVNALPNDKTEAVATIPVAELAEFTKRTTFCIPNDLTGQRANLAALKLADNATCEEAFATNGSIAVHVSSFKKQGKGTGLGINGLLIPSTALQPLQSIVAKRNGKENVDIVVLKNKVYFRFADGTRFGALTMSTQYPNLRPVIDQSLAFTFEIPTEGLKHSLNRTSNFVPTSSTKRILEVEFGDDKLTLRANGEGSFVEALPITYKLAKPEVPVKMGFDIQYLFDIVSNSQSPNLTFGFSKDTAPLVVIDNNKVEDDDDVINTKYVVMGVRIGAQK